MKSLRVVTGLQAGLAMATALLVIACEPSAPPASVTSAAAGVVEREGLAMGSSLHLTAWTSDRTAAETAFDETFAEFERLDARLSVWRDGSDVLRVNAAAGAQPVPVGEDFREVVAIARQIGEWTEGKFDVTFGALSDVWRFDHDQDNRVPSPEQIADRLPLINFRALVVDDRAGTAFLQHRGMRVHLGGIGKGYAIDKAIAIFRRHGLKDFMIQAGGDLYAGGRRGDRPWRLGINDPRGPGGDSFASVEVTDSTFSTSGDYERFFMKDGVRYHHILDPDTGQPARGARSVTILSDRAVLADGLSTGVFLLGPEKGLALIERLPGVEGVIVTSENRVLVSSGLNDRLTFLHLPADSP